jgi:predicted nicotinamide N-methyase
MARLEIVQLESVPGLRLALINADFPQSPLRAEVMHAVLERPAYWAFCWASGLGLARLLFAHPEWVAGRRVVDLGSGSGVAGIAAALCGAATVVACDLDPDARAATELNARINGVEIEVVASLEGIAADVLLMADVLYDAANVELLEQATSRARVVWLADSRVKRIANPGFRLWAEVDASTSPNLGEFDEFRRVRIFRYQASGAG